jgi:hypothetical protein
MLDKTSSTTALPPAQTTLVIGQSIARRHYPNARARAHEAAVLICTGGLIKPTVHMLASAYQCSEALIWQEVAKLGDGGAVPVSPLAALWAAATLPERDEFVREYLEGVWASVERVTVA